MHLAPLALAAVLLAAPAAAEKLVVVELFTSPFCPACPPAEALTAEMAHTDATLLPLDLHVTYWDRPGRRDPRSLPAADERQRGHAARLGGPVYTPQVVVAGRHAAVGTDPGAVWAAVARARGEDSVPVPLDLAAEGGKLRVRAGAGVGEGTLWLVGYDAPRAGRGGSRPPGGGNVVRAVVPAGTWHGAPLALSLARPAGERAAVLLQDASGRILAAAAEP